MTHTSCREYDYSRVAVGSVVGRLTVLEKLSERTKNGSVIWICQCDCGEVVKAQSSSLNSGLKQSCGCLEEDTRTTRRSTHGRSRTREYNSWLAMRQRCYYPKSDHYHSYGGRGIGVSEEWREDFEVFYLDMGDCPAGMTLDRKDVNKGYSKENCRWATASVQGFNCRIKSSNTSGRTGVSWNKRLNKWVACIGFEGKSLYLGSFESKDVAISTREAAEIHYFGTTKE